MDIKVVHSVFVSEFWELFDEGIISSYADLGHTNNASAVFLPL